jgi:hypothetical protein
MLGKKFKITNSSLYYYFALMIVIIIISLLRIRLLDFPLERDEGGFAYMGKLILNGDAPYVAGYDFKPPGLYLTYAIFIKLFGATASGIHLGLIICNAISMIFLYLFCKKYFGGVNSIVSTLIYGVLAFSPGVLGFAAHASHFVVMWMLIGYVLLFAYQSTTKLYYLILSGIAFSLSSLMKQPGIVFLFSVIIILIFPIIAKRKQLRLLINELIFFIIGTLIPIILMMIWLWKIDAVKQFIFWNITYGYQFGEIIGWQGALVQLKMGFQKVINNFEVVWLISVIGLLTFIFDHNYKSQKYLIVFFGAASVIAISMGFHFRIHYFILILPFIGIAASYIICKSINMFIKNNYLSEIAQIFVVIFILGIGILGDQKYFFTENTTNLSRLIYFPNPFAESKVVADYIQTHSNTDDRIAILGSEPQILFYADRYSATPYLFTYFLMDSHPYSFVMQQEMIGDIEKTKPKIIIFLNIPISWGIWDNSEKHIITWSKQYIKQSYSLVGIVDVLSRQESVIKWNDEAKQYPHISTSTILIFKRIPQSG